MEGGPLTPSLAAGTWSKVAGERIAPVAVLDAGMDGRAGMCRSIRQTQRARSALTRALLDGRAWETVKYTQGKSCGEFREQ